jgi:hypothetical protein
LDQQTLAASTAIPVGLLWLETIGVIVPPVLVEVALARWIVPLPALVQ